MNIMEVVNKSELVDLFETITTSKYIYIPEKPQKIIAALYNSDLKHSLLEILEMDTDLFIEGMKILKQISNASEMEIYIPEENNKLDYNLLNELKENEILLKYGLVNRRENKNNLLCHFEHVVKVAMLNRKEDINFTYLSINAGTLRKISYRKNIGELLRGCDGNISFIEIDNKYYDKTIFQKNIKDINILNGSINTFDESSCIINIANKDILEYREKSCGKCLFCREGLIQINSMMDDISIGKGKLSYIDLMNEIGEAMNISGNCSLGNEAAEGILSSLKIREADYLEHIKKRKCNSGVCISNEKIYIDPNLCTGCEECVSSCTLNCIDGRKGYIHMLYDLDCTKCGECITKCSIGAIKKTTGKIPRLPDRLIKSRMFK